jgi:hypothetical protein
MIFASDNFVAPLPITSSCKSLAVTMTIWSVFHRRGVATPYATTTNPRPPEKGYTWRERERERERDLARCSRIKQFNPLDLQACMSCLRMNKNGKYIKPTVRARTLPRCLPESFPLAENQQQQQQQHLSLSRSGTWRPVPFPMRAMMQNRCYRCCRHCRTC